MKNLSRVRTWFVFSVIALLLLTVGAKLISFVQHKPFLATDDGIVPHMNKQQTLAIAAVLETVTAVFMFVKRKRPFALIACFWLAALFASYRMVGKALSLAAPCHCMGDFLDWAGLPRVVADNLPVVVLWYMALGSGFFLLAGGRHVEPGPDEVVNGPGDKQIVSSP